MKKSTKDRILAETSEETKQKARDYGDSLVKKIYTEEEAKILAGNVSADLGIYIAYCFVNKTLDPQTEKKFEELYEKHRKK